MSRNALHGLVPFGVRVWLRQQKRRMENLVSRERLARERGAAAEFPVRLARRESPLKRPASGSLGAYTEEKTANLKIGCECLDTLRVGPGEILSFCETIGPTTQERGFQDALEMRDGQETTAPGGGLCQLANALMLLAIDCGFEITERHRHSFDLFPDADRNVPFGIGATVFYNYVDLRLRNTLPLAVIFRAEVTESKLVVSVFGRENLPFTNKLVETDHHFERRDDGHIYRCNKLWIDRGVDGTTTRTLLYENACRVMYPADHLVDGEEGGES